jgi:hypothetical protein
MSPCCGQVVATAAPVPHSLACRPSALDCGWHQPRLLGSPGKIGAQMGVDGHLDWERGPSIRRPHKLFGPTTFSEQR